MFKHLRIGAYPLASTLVLVFCGTILSAPCGPASMLSAEDFPAADEIVILEELTDWVGAPAPGSNTETKPQTLRQVIRDRWTSFEVFRQYHDQATRHEALADIPFGESIRQVAEAHGLDGLLLAAMVQVESGFDPYAVSHRGAVGLMQVLPSTAQVGGEETLKDPEVNLQAGASYMSWLLERYEGDLELALAAYNAGPGAVRRHGGVPPFRETRNYLNKVLRIYVDLHREVWQSSEDGEILASL